MRFLLSTLVALAIAVSSSAQSSANSLSLSVGPSFPLARFSSTETTHYTNGFAKTGVHINIGFEHKFNNSFAFSALFFGQANAVNTEGYLGNVRWYWYNGRYQNLQFSKATWLLTGLLVGGANEFPLLGKQNKLLLNVKSLIGVVHGTGPKFDITSTMGNGRSNLSVSCNSGYGTAYLLSGGLKYHFHKNYFLLTNLQYLFVSEIKLNQEETSTYYNEKYSIPITPEVTALNVMMGIGFNW